MMMQQRIQDQHVAKVIRSTVPLRALALLMLLCTTLTTWATTGDKFSLTVTATTETSVGSQQTLSLISDYATITGGTATLFNGHNSSSQKMVQKSEIYLNGSNSSYMAITLTTALAEGDIIAITSTESEPQFHVATSTTKPDNKDNTHVTSDKTTKSYTVLSNDAIVGKTQIYIFNSSKTKFSTLTITSSDGGDTPDTPVAPSTTASSFKVTSSTATAANTELWTEAKNARVVLGGWMFPNTVTPTSGITTETFGDTEYTWGKVDTPKTTDADYVANYTCLIEEGTNRNARQENGSNAQPMSTSIYKGTNDYKGDILDPMFNVPCSGSYLVFTAQTPGSITAVVRQNGAFDTNSKAETNPYRPQRRVFILDEAGKIVPSTATLMNTSGSLPKKNGSSDLSTFTWDIENATMPTTEAGIMQHFVGLTSFSTSSFKNGVYESNLSYDICRNEVLNDDNLKSVTGKGYRGWVALVDAPVSYTFDVKPGKTYYLYNFGSRIGFYGYTFTPTNVTVDEIAYKENEQNSVTATADGHTATVNLDRTFKGGLWNAAVLPFSLNKQQIDEIFGTCYSSGYNEGTQILYFDRTEGSKIYFKRHAYNTIVAGKPFLIKPAKSGDININTANISESGYRWVTIEKTTADNFGLNHSTADYCWTSGYEPQTVAAGDYFLRDFQANSKDADGNMVRLPVSYTGQFSIGAFRGYLKAKDDATRSSAKSLTIAITSFDDTETTYISNVSFDSDGTLSAASDSKVYNMQGQLVGTGDNIDALPKGLYIVNGKKIMK